MNLVGRLRSSIAALAIVTTLASCYIKDDSDKYYEMPRTQVTTGNTSQCEWTVWRNIVPKPGDLDVMIYYDALITCNKKSATYFGSEDYMKKIVTFTVTNGELYQHPN